ncbi:MAG: putative baseplate assembly protein [Caldilineae bacterium]|nr:putative baseplate assembly protein [Caldilineae bacterium]
MPLTVPNLDDRNFEQLVAEARARIPVHTPEWTNLNDSDPGITLVQLFAFMTENLLYRSNRIPERNRKKFLSLLNIPLRPASPARGLVQFHNERGPVQAWPLQAGIEVRAGKVPFITRTGLCVLPVEAHGFYKQATPDLDDATRAQYRLLYETFLETPADELQFYQATPLEAPEIGKPLPVVDLADSQRGVVDRSLWLALAGPKGVPVDTVRAAIAGQTLTLGIYPAPQCDGLALRPEQTSADAEAVTDPGLVFEIAAPDPLPSDNGIVGGGPARYRRLTPEYAENVLERPGIVQLVLPAYSDLLVWDFDPQEEGAGDYPPLVEDRQLAARIATWIRVRLPEWNQDGATTASSQQARLSWVGANAARAVQAVPVVFERLGVGSGAPEQTFQVANTPVIQEQVASKAGITGVESSLVLEVQNADGGWDTWRQVDDIYVASSQDQVYTLDPEAGRVTFGDGLRGLRPPLGRVIRASYEYGGGPQGQVAIDAIAKSPALPGGFTVGNPVATWDGAPGETTAEGERNIPRYLQHRDRLVTANDFRDITLRTPGVDMGRVEVLSLFNPELPFAQAITETWPGGVTLLVIPRYDPQQPDAPQPDRLFLRAVCDWIDPRRLVTTELFVRGPQYVPVYVSVGIATMPGQVRELVRQAVVDAIKTYLSPLTGGPPVEGAADIDTVCGETPDTSAGCPTPRGLGWPLHTDVRRQDLEAVATRVAGVRYVNPIKLGTSSASGATMTDVESISIRGLQLPHLVAINVREGEAEDLDVILGQQPSTGAPPNLVSVPVLPKAC